MTSQSALIVEGTLLWQPSPTRRTDAKLTEFAQRAVAHGAPPVTADEAGAAALWKWSTTDLDGFWRSVLDWFDVPGSAWDGPLLAVDRMPGASWFPGARVNYAEQVLRRSSDADAVVAVQEDGEVRKLSFAQLRREVGAAQAGLRRLGVGEGDRVVAVLPNGIEALVAFLATAALGAVWSSCSPDFGARSLIDRFAQVEPVVLIGVDGYHYGGRPFDTRAALAELRGGLPTLRATVFVPHLDAAARLEGAITWAELTSEAAEPSVTRVRFDAPLWILYSSGTTGPPKAIVQGHGGILLEHLKSLGLHLDLSDGDRFLWFTTTGWMMWNYLASGLLVGATVVLYDGSPAYPEVEHLWHVAAQYRVTVLGTSAPYLSACAAAGVVPRNTMDLSSLRTLGSTGAPLSPSSYAWVYEAVADDLLLASISGGTDLCTAFATSHPWLPVRAGILQCRALGAAVATYDANGAEVVGALGELVVTRPMPSMPLHFWGDDGSRLTESYFTEFPGVWRHGDWAKLDEHGGVIINGRSDATLNRGGVRIGTAEFYRVVEDLPEVLDSLVVDTGGIGQGEDRLLLFLVLDDAVDLDDDLRSRLRSHIRTALSPRHVPDQIIAVPEVPRTVNGKKLEVPVKRLITGTPLERAVSLSTVANPDALKHFTTV